MMTRDERRRQRAEQAALDTIADEVAAELGDWTEAPAPEPAQVVSIEERRANKQT